MKLYWTAQTRSSRAVWLLEELGIDYDVETVDIRSDGREDSGNRRIIESHGGF